jgi:hypothetical protein
MTLKIPETIASSQDLITLTLEIREYAKWFAHESIKKRVSGGHGSPTPALSPAASQLIRESRSQKELASKNIETLVTTLDDYARSSPTITFTLAAPPTGSIKTTLVAWCRENIAPNILVTFRFNATLLGGMVVQYGSRVFDWSFRRQILAERARFPEILRHV